MEPKRVQVIESYIIEEGFFAVNQVKAKNKIKIKILLSFSIFINIYDLG